MANEQEINDRILLQAIRKRILEEIQNRQAAATIQNIIGGQGGPMGSQGGVFESLGQGQGPSRGPQGQQEIDPGLFDYYVDIMKNDIVNPETGKSEGWSKRVHRFRSPIDEKKK